MRIRQGWRWIPRGKVPEGYGYQISGIRGVPQVLDIWAQNSYADFCFIKRGLSSTVP